MIKKILINSILYLCIASIVIAESREKEWSHSLSLGYNRTKGNSDTELFNTSYAADKKKKKTKIKFGIDVQVGREDKEQSANNYNFYGQYNRRYSKRNYWYLNASYDIDKIADLDSRITIGPGLGRSIFEKERLNMDIEAGLSYISEDYKGVPNEDDTAVRIAENLKYKLSKTASLWQEAEYLGVTDDSDKYLFNAQFGILSSLNGALSIKSFIENKHNSRPASGKKRNDTSFITMIVLNF